MKRIYLLLVTIALILIAHSLLLYNENLYLFDFSNWKVLKSLFISSFLIILIGGIILYQNKKK